MTENPPATDTYQELLLVTAVYSFLLKHKIHNTYVCSSNGRAVEN
jgi:hypothetical protein